MYRRDHDTIILSMTVDDFQNLILLMGQHAGLCSRVGETELFWQAIGVVNRLNVGNPDYTPYEIPEAFAK